MPSNYNFKDSSQNLLLYSEQFNNAVWTPVTASCVFTKNVTGPDNIPNSAWTIDDQSNLGDGAAFEQTYYITPSTTTNYCLSIFAKQGTANYFDFYAFFVGTSVKGSYFRYTFSTDTISVSSADGGGITPTIYGKVSYPNGWYRFYFVVNDANNGLNNTFLYRIYPASRDVNVTGTTLFYGAQLEERSSLSNYTPTTTSRIKNDNLIYSFDDIFVPADLFRQGGGVWNWGRGVAGALGDTFTNSFASTPITTFSGGSNWKQVSTGGLHTAAIKSDGTLWVWGYNIRGQLGNAQITDRSTPVTTFAGGNNWKQVECGTSHTLAIKTDGTLWTWGNNSRGQLGVYGRINKSTPITTFVGGTNWKSVAGGYHYSAAIKTDGTLWTWGYAYFGQLGKGGFYTLVRSTPMTTFAGGNNWADTATGVAEELYTLSAGGSFSSAIKTDGTLWTWGYGFNGQLGNGATTNRSTPGTTFAGGTNWKQVSSTDKHSAAVKTDGTLWVWGNGSNGRLGNAVTTNTSTPVTTFAGGTNWRQVSCRDDTSGNAHTAAIKTDGTLWVWGVGGDGRLGNGVTNFSGTSTPITTFAGGSDWKQVSCGFTHTVAIKTNGTLWAWGTCENGQLGNAQITDRSTPVTTFAGGTNWRQVSAGFDTTSAIKTDGTLWVWGSGGRGTLGNGITANGRSTPITTFAGGTNWRQVTCGQYHMSAVKTDGTLWTWGFTQKGQLGIGYGAYEFNVPIEYNVRSTPVTTFVGGSNWKQVSAGGQHTVALNDDGVNKRLYTWGYNRNNQIGDGFFIEINDAPGKVGNSSNWKQVSCSYHSTAALKTDGTLWTWGDNVEGQLATSKLYKGSAEPVTTFVGGTDWKQVSAGGYYTVNMMAAIKTDGTLWTWGNSYAGILGNGVASVGSVSTPVTTFAGGTNWKQVSAGGYHMSALKTDGTLWTWGNDDQEQLGIGYQLTQAGINYASTPVTTFAGGRNWKSVGSSGGYRVCAIQYVDSITYPPDLFRLFAWGEGFFGVNGNFNTTNLRSTPVTTFSGGTNWKQVSAGNFSAAAIKTDGTLWTWGSGSDGALGQGGTNFGTIETPITTFAGGNNWKQVSVGYHMSAIKTDGTLWTWGGNFNGELGINATTNRSTPVTTFAGGTNWKQVSSGFNSTAAIKTDGTLWTWGANNFLQIGNATTIDISTPVTTFAGGTNWKQVSANIAHMAAIKTDGTLWVWGATANLGNGVTTGNTSTPITTFAGGTDWQKVSTGVDTIGAIKTNGTLWVWGFSGYGALGNALVTTGRITTPITTFAGGTNWKQVTCGQYHMSAIKTDGTLWTWGYTSNGILGNATGGYSGNSKVSTPITTFAGGTNWEEVHATRRNTLAIRKN